MSTTTTTSAITSAAELQKAVDEIVSQKSQSITTTIADSLADGVLKARTKALTDAFAGLKSNLAARDTYKPDATITDGDGKVISEGFTPSLAQRRKVYQDQANLLDEAIKAALAGDFEPLKKAGYQVG